MTEGFKNETIQIILYRGQVMILQVLYLVSVVKSQIIKKNIR